jgi:hypothetical protein
MIIITFFSLVLPSPFSHLSSLYPSQPYSQVLRQSFIDRIRNHPFHIMAALQVARITVHTASYRTNPED